MDVSSKIMVVDAADMLGDAICRMLRKQGYQKLLPVSEQDLDLMERDAVFQWYEAKRPEYVFCFAGSHGGIFANTKYPADFAYRNLTIQNNIIHGAYLYGVKRMIFMVGGCVYPKVCSQPIKESDFQTGLMEPTSVAYSMARCAGVEMCLAYNRQYQTQFIPAVFSNYFGINDDYSENGHVLASIMRKMYEAKQNGDEKLVLWGTGEPLRQFLYMDDLANGAIHIMNHMEHIGLINIAGGFEKSIKEVAETLQKLIGYEGEIVFDATKPNGTMRKLMDNTKLRELGWTEQVGWEDGLQEAYTWFLENVAKK